jgi:hypothetical protein
MTSVYQKERWTTTLQSGSPAGLRRSGRSVRRTRLWPFGSIRVSASPIARRLTGICGVARRAGWWCCRSSRSVSAGARTRACRLRETMPAVRRGSMRRAGRGGWSGGVSRPSQRHASRPNCFVSSTRGRPRRCRLETRGSCLVIPDASGRISPCSRRVVSPSVPLRSGGSAVPMDTRTLRAAAGRIREREAPRREIRRPWPS